MTKYSENEKETFQLFLSDFDMRCDGRQNLEIRPYIVEYNTLPSTYSSIKIIYGNKSNEIILAVKGDIVKKSNEKLLNVNIESMFKIEDLKIKKEMEDHIETLIFKYINNKELQINEDSKEYYWKLYIDLFVMDSLKFSIFQYIAVGVKLLIQNIKLPKVVLLKNEINGETEYDLLENYKDVSEHEKLRCFNNLFVPDVFCFGLYKNSIILDPSEEEFVVLESIIIISSLNGEIENMQSIGSSIDLSKIQEISKLVKTINKRNDNRMDEN